MTTQHFTAWACVVAGNAWVDLLRRSRRDVVVDVVPDRAAREATDELALALLTFDRLNVAIVELPDAQRCALLQHRATWDGDRRGSTRDAVARHRARARLRTVWEAIA